MIYDTPDLSKSYNPVPKPHKVEKVKQSKISAGDKTNEWTEARKEIKEQFVKWGITKCEFNGPNCWKNNALTFAHSMKRRKMTKDDLSKVALLCTPCHQEIEVMPPEAMQDIVEGIIRVRKVKSV